MWVAEESLPDDSTITNYVGEGGTYRALQEQRLRLKLSVGVNFGYRFGSKDYNTNVYILNDTATDRYVAGEKWSRTVLVVHFLNWACSTSLL